MDSKEKSLFNKTFYYTIIFFVGSFIGYLYEVIFYLLDDHKLVNRGFLYGPYLPVYGFGAILLIVTLRKFKKHPLSIFILAMLVTGITEYVAGFLVYKVYHEMWWDYTGLYLSINGYVCLRSVISFAIGALLLFYLVEPLIVKKLLPLTKGKKVTIFSILILVIMIDLVFTLIFRHPL